MSTRLPFENLRKTGGYAATGFLLSSFFFLLSQTHPLFQTHGFARILILMITMTPTRLILFDIDGTLISPGRMPRVWLSEAINELSGEEEQHLTLDDVAGKTDTLIIETALLKLGVSRWNIRKMIFPIINRYLEKLSANYASDSTPKFVFPGVKEILERLNWREDILLGLVTGNTPDSARIKLSHFGLWEYFKLGAFATDSKHRNDLPKIALRLANQMNHTKFEAEHAVMIGDTLNDLEAARVNKMRSLIVGHHPYWRKDLRAGKPDLYVDDFSAPEHVLKWLIES